MYPTTWSRYLGSKIEPLLFIFRHSRPVLWSISLPPTPRHPPIHVCYILQRGVTKWCIFRGIEMVCSKRTFGGYAQLFWVFCPR